MPQCATGMSSSQGMWRRMRCRCCRPPWPHRTASSGVRAVRRCRVGRPHRKGPACCAITIRRAITSLDCSDPKARRGAKRLSFPASFSLKPHDLFWQERQGGNGCAAKGWRGGRTGSTRRWAPAASCGHPVIQGCGRSPPGNGATRVSSWISPATHPRQGPASQRMAARPGRRPIACRSKRGCAHSNCRGTARGRAACRNAMRRSARQRGAGAARCCIARAPTRWCRSGTAARSAPWAGYWRKPCRPALACGSKRLRE